MDLSKYSILICGQGYTSRTETVEKYFIKVAKKVGVIAIDGIRHRQISNARLYDDGKIIRKWEMKVFHSTGESILFTFSVFIYLISVLKNTWNAFRKLNTKFDLFIGIQTWYTFIGILLKKFGKVDKVLYYCIDYYFPTKRFGSKIETYFFKYLDRYCCKNADFIWNLSIELEKGRKKAFPNDDYSNKELIVPLTYSESLLTFCDIDKIERHSLAFVGGLESEQGWEVLMKAIPIVLKKYADFKMHIFGEGTYVPEILKLIKQEKISKNIVMHGFIKDDSELLKKLSRCAAGIGLYPPFKAQYTSLDGGKPKFYALAGLPILMDHTDYVEEQLKKFGVGKTYEYNPNSMAQSIIDVIDDDEKLIQYKKNANEFAKKFTSEVIFPDVMKKTMNILNR